MARTFEHGEAQLRVSVADDLPLYFGGDPRDPHFLQAAANPDPRATTGRDTEEEAHLALDEGELPLVVPARYRHAIAARALVNDVQQRCTNTGRAVSEAVELLRRGLPREAQSLRSTRRSCRATTRKRRGCSARLQPLEGQADAKGRLYRPVLSTTPRRSRRHRRCPR